MSRWLTASLAMVIVLASMGAGRSIAQDVHRCVTADGSSIFTDRDCDDLHAVERASPTAPSAAPNHLRGCARSTNDLLFGVRLALDAQDVNKLASFYHWTGVGTEESVGLMDRLETLSRRPLVDVALAGFEGKGPGDDPPLPAAGDSAPGQRHSLPDRLLIEQMESADSLRTLRTTLHLQKNLGCWWIRF